MKHILRMLPSDEWQITGQHWHAYTHNRIADATPDAALFDPADVATWIAQHSSADLWSAHYLIASRGDSIRHYPLIVAAVLEERCRHGCTPALRTRTSSPRAGLL